jgi:two-component system, NtrC family, nitrogen regulation sensor histidine kinase NtrY
MPAGKLFEGEALNQRSWTQKLWLAVGGVSVVLLAATIFTLGSLRAPVHAAQGYSLVILFAVSLFVCVAFFIFSLVLSRSILRLASERKAGVLGSRFKIKMVFGAMGISLLPLVFLFLFSYSLVNRTLNLWFPKPLEIANAESQKLLDEFANEVHQRLNLRAARVAPTLDERGVKAVLDDSQSGAAIPLDAIWIVDGKGAVRDAAPASLVLGHLRYAQSLPSGVAVWQTDSDTYITGYAPVSGGDLFVGRKLGPGFLSSLSTIQAQMQEYEQQRQQIRLYKRQILVALSLITLLLLSATTWVALYLSKQVTVPIQLMAEATQEVARGNFDHRVAIQAQDELGTLVNSFNDMTAQLGEGRRQINEFTKSLQQAVEERDRRRKLMEAILENIPTGVLSLDAEGGISRINSAIVDIFGEPAREARTLSDLFGAEASRPVVALMRRSLRMGAASREIEIASSGRLVRAAVTVSALGTRRANPGFVVVIDDLSELLRAQKAAAWQEVAQRIAHEIKNPLTPIMLSAQRLRRFLERADSATSKTELGVLVRECAALIEREVHALESLVGEFSQFARFPAARLTPADINEIVRSALALFQGRLDGVQVKAELAAGLPAVNVDDELLRRVLTNLIDNAAEAMEDSKLRRLAVITRAREEGDAVEIEIADTGHGISPEDKERLFLPHFSTKERGTGLGLAIASRIVSEHKGSLRVEDNEPVGSRFIIRFPAVESAAVSASSSPAATAASIEEVTDEGTTD